MADEDRAVARELAYLSSLRKAERMEHFAARVRLLRSHGWEMRSLASDLGVSRQWLYQTLSAHPDASPPADAPRLLDLRPPSDHDLVMRSDAAEVPPPLCDPLAAMWRHVFRDKSAGTSPVAVLLDVTVALLARRGVPFVRIAACGNVTHRTVAERIRRARQRGTMPAALKRSFLQQIPKQSPRTKAQAQDPHRLVTLAQVVQATFPRFYTLRRKADDRASSFSPMRMFDPSQPVPGDISDTGLDEFTLVTSEREWVRAVRRAQPDASALYAVPVQWLYVSSHPHVWRPDVFDPVGDFYPAGLLEYVEPASEFVTDPRAMLRQVEPIVWRGQR